ncbi:hypothetical protein C7I55_10380 [Sphingomonas deserti]|uniref:Uncharacterized protein n=1 Tax=Allosphingosinicella deserti TaxID=2116704 RepID=A0A2P7QRV9_9SPHN|nr:hypothetical protein C7I55_10380 [Sphingomonas deserti]
MTLLTYFAAMGRILRRGSGRVYRFEGATAPAAGLRVTDWGSPDSPFRGPEEARLAEERSRQAFNLWCGWVLIAF